METTDKEMAINTEQYGDCNEVNYELIVKDNIPKQRIREVIEEMVKGSVIDRINANHLLKELGLE